MSDPTTIIVTYVHNRTYFLPRCVSKEEFEYISYSIWAATEILHRLQDSPTMNPAVLMEQFITEMTMYSRWGDDAGRIIFAIAADAGEELLALVERRD